MRRVIIVTLLSATMLTLVESARLKFFLENRNRTLKYNRTRNYNWTKTGSLHRPGCDSLVAFDGDLSVKLTAIQQAKPDDAQFYTDATRADVLEDLLEQNVEGTDKSPKEFFTLLKEEKECATYIYGGAVRDILRGIPPEQIKDIDAETDCNLLEVHELCIQHFEVDLYDTSICSLTTGYNFALVTFGDHDYHRQEVIDLGGTEKTFFGSKNYLEYTANAVAYDYLGQKLFFNLAKDGVMHACNQKIGIPVAPADYDTWAVGAGTQKNGKKIFRYWKLLLKEFQPLNDDISDYVEGKARQFIARGGWKAMKGYFCRIMYDVKEFYNYPNGEGCLSSQVRCNAANLDKASAMKALLKRDLDWDVPTCGNPDWHLGE